MKPETIKDEQLIEIFKKSKDNSREVKIRVKREEIENFIDFIIEYVETYMEEHAELLKEILKDGIESKIALYKHYLLHKGDGDLSYYEYASKYFPEFMEETINLAKYVRNIREVARGINLKYNGKLMITHLRFTPEGIEIS